MARSELMQDRERRDHAPASYEDRSTFGEEKVQNKTKDERVHAGNIGVRIAHRGVTRKREKERVEKSMPKDENVGRF